MRLFTAVRLEAGIRDAVAAAVSSLRSDPGLGSAIKWVEPENLHITLQFLGEVPPRAGDALVEAWVSPLVSTAARVSLGQVAPFPSRGRLRGVWVDVRCGDGAFLALRDAVQVRLTPLGYKSEDRPFRPHLTIGRLRRTASLPRRRLVERLSGVSLPSRAWPVREVVLFESRPGRPGPTYHPLAEISLSG